LQVLKHDSNLASSACRGVASWRLNAATTTMHIRNNATSLFAIIVNLYGLVFILVVFFLLFLCLGARSVGMDMCGGRCIYAGVLARLFFFLWGATFNHGKVCGYAHLKTWVFE
jgi:hypothetical protein